MGEPPTGREEAGEELFRLEDNLRDLEEAIRFEYTFTAAHIGGRQVRRDEEELTQLKLRIAELRALFDQKEELGL